MSDIYLYDTTLRDGTQREGISLSADDKIKIAHRLDEFGVHYIEGVWPGSNPKDAEFFQRMQDINFMHAKMAAFGSTLKKNKRPEDDANIQMLLAAGTPVVTLVGKSWDLHVNEVLETSLSKNLEMIGDSVAYFKERDKKVVYDAEHFFDGYKANPSYALKTLIAAAENGAQVVVLCDTNGGSLPWEIEEICKTVGDKVSVAFGIHAHDDGGCGVANTLAAVRVGAVQVQVPSMVMVSVSATPTCARSSRICSSRWENHACLWKTSPSWLNSPITWLRLPIYPMIRITLMSDRAHLLTKVVSTWQRC